METTADTIPVPSWDGAETPGGRATPPAAEPEGGAPVRGRATEQHGRAREERGRSTHRGRGRGRARPELPRSPGHKGKGLGGKSSKGKDKGAGAGRGRHPYTMDDAYEVLDENRWNQIFGQWSAVAGWSSQVPGWYQSPQTGIWMFWTGAQWLSYEPSSMDGSWHLPRREAEQAKGREKGPPHSTASTLEHPSQHRSVGVPLPEGHGLRAKAAPKEAARKEKKEKKETKDKKDGRDKSDRSAKDKKKDRSDKERPREQPKEQRTKTPPPPSAAEKGEKSDKKEKKDKEKKERQDDDPRPSGRDDSQTPSKKSKAAPPNPDPPGEDDDEEYSEYTYEEQEESEESEGFEEDPPVTPSNLTDDSRGPRQYQRNPRDPRLRPPPGPPSSDPTSSNVTSTPAASNRTSSRASGSSASTASTGEIRALLGQQAKKQQDRSKPSLSQVRLEMFRGSRSHFKEWKHTIEAQQALDEAELAMLIYLSCQGEPRQILNQLQVSEMREPGGLNRVMRLLEESYGARSDERFEERQEAYLTYRRAPGQSVASYISALKRLRTEYLAEDTGTTLSDKSFAQRMLSRASLTKKERMDIFYSAGGKYASNAIEKVLKFRCSNVHLDETKYRPQDKHHHPRRWKTSSTSKSSRPKPHRSSRAHLANVKEEPDWDDDEEGIPEEEGDDEAYYENEDDEADNEDLEQEAYQQDYYWDDEDEEGDWDWDDEGMDLREAYAAGWRAKQKSAEARKARGYSDAKSKGKGKKGKKGGGRFVEYRTKDQRKAKSKCASCKQIGHWHGDPECPNVKNGTDPPRDDPAKSQVNFTTDTSPTARGSGTRTKEEVKQEEDDGNRHTWSTKGLNVHKVNWTFMEGWQRIKAYSSDSSSAVSSPSSSSEPEEPLGFSAGRSSEEASAQKKASKYKAALRTVVSALAEEVDESDLKLKKKLLKKQGQLQEKEKELAKAKSKAKGSKPVAMETDLAPADMLEILPHMSKDEKRRLYKELKAERDREAARYLDQHQTAEKLKRTDKRHDGGYKAASSSTTPAPEPASTSDLPEPVRRKRLKQFRKDLYDGALDRKGRVRPSEASELPTPEQEKCPHPWQSLRWGANGAAHWASCKACKLKKVLYYSMDHGALTAETVLEEDPMDVWMLEHAAHKVILDSGCRAAVAGAKWHVKMRQALDQRDLPYEVLEHEETFRFGAGAPVLSTEAGLYPVVLGGTGIRSWLRVAVVDDTKQDPRISNCLALVGPSELARWKVTMDFAKGMTVIDGCSTPTELSPTRHPVLEILGDDGKAEDWNTSELRELRAVLRADPRKLALWQSQDELPPPSRRRHLQMNLRCLSTPWLSQNQISKILLCGRATWKMRPSVVWTRSCTSPHQGGGAPG